MRKFDDQAQLVTHIFDGESNDDNDPFVALRKQMDEMFEDFGQNLPMKSGGLSARQNASETEKEVCINAELPGISMEDVDVSIEGNRISVSGEKVSEEEEKKEDEGRQFRRVERMSGSFRRVMTMPFEIDLNSVKAHAKDGVLTVTIPTPLEQVAKAKKIKIESSGQKIYRELNGQYPSGQFNTIRWDSN